MTAEQLEELPISEDSLQIRIGDIGNCIHNLSCEHQDDDELASRLQEVRGKAWGLSIDVGALERRVLAAEKLYRALSLAEHDQIDFDGVCHDYVSQTDDESKIRMRKMRADAVSDRLSITRAALTAYREASK